MVVVTNGKLDFGPW